MHSYAPSANMLNGKDAVKKEKTVNVNIHWNIALTTSSRDGVMAQNQEMTAGDFAQSYLL